MVPADHHRGADLSLLHQVVERATERGTLALSQPTDAGGQSLEGDALPGEPDPARQVLVLGKQHLARWIRLAGRSEEHTSELQSRLPLVCPPLLEKKKK